MRREASAERRATLAGGVLLAWLAGTGGAQAQDAACFPACRDGYVCQAGACVAVQAPPENVVPQNVGPQYVGPQPGGAGAGAGPQAGAPLWGPGAQAGGAGAQSWTPGAAPTPLSREEQERRAIRTKVRFVLYAIGLMGSEFWDEGDGQQYSTGNDFEVGGGLGVGVRYNFTRAFGVQARLLGTVDNAASFGLYDSGGNATWDEQVIGIDVIGELGVRLGPVSDSVPWYFGFLLGVGGRFLTGDAMCYADARTMCRWSTGGEAMTYPDGGVFDLSPSFFGIDAGVETGFVFGSMEQFDIGLRSTWLTNANGNAQYGGSIFFGWAVL